MSEPNPMLVILRTLTIFGTVKWDTEKEHGLQCSHWVFLYYWCCVEHFNVGNQSISRPCPMLEAPKSCNCAVRTEVVNRSRTRNCADKGTSKDQLAETTWFVSVGWCCEAQDGLELRACYILVGEGGYFQVGSRTNPMECLGGNSCGIETSSNHDKLHYAHLCTVSAGVSEVVRQNLHQAPQHGTSKAASVFAHPVVGWYWPSSQFYVCMKWSWLEILQPSERSKCPL